jgi:hypothetical protein
VREKGEFVKSPSIFIHGVKFVRDYADRGSARSSCDPPERMSIIVETRIVGAAEMLVLQHPVDSTWQPLDVSMPIDATPSLPNESNN